MNEFPLARGVQGIDNKHFQWHTVVARNCDKNLAAALAPQDSELAIEFNKPVTRQNLFALTLALKAFERDDDLITVRCFDPMQ